MVSIHDPAGMDAFLRARRLDPQLGRRVRNAFFKRSRTAHEALSAMPPAARADAESELAFHALSPVLSRRSNDGATRLLLQTRAGLSVESVILRIGTGRTTLCVSSQIGCAARCRFCATGTMGMAVNLDTDEILDQLTRANTELLDEDRRIRNVVFMGMGEPLHNEAAVHRAIDVLLDPRCFDMADRFVTVSTVGIPDAMVRLVERHPGIGLALSLHAARQEVRERLLPVARRHDLGTLRRALVDAQRIQDRTTMIEYILLDGVNDGDDDLQALIDYLDGLRVRINLLPYNPIPDAPELAPTPRDRRKRFGDALRSAGYQVTTRVSLGGDLSAACGQLARSRERERLRALTRLRAPGASCS